MQTIIVVAVVLAMAGLWDLYVIRRWGPSSGRTVSWQLYTDSRNTPAIAFFAGVLVDRAIVLTGTSDVVALLLWVAGHIFGVMRGA